MTTVADRPVSEQDAKHTAGGSVWSSDPPMLVALPIGAWLASFAFDLGSFWAGEGQVFAKGAFWLVSRDRCALAAAAFGLMDLLPIRRGTRAFRTGITRTWC